MFSIQTHLQLKHEADIYFLRIRPGRQDLLVNYNYNGLLIIDCVSGAETGKVVFPEDDFSIYTFVTSPDGRYAYLFSPDEKDYALQLDLDSQTVSKIRLESAFHAPTELCWFVPSLHILDYEYRVWRLENDILKLAPAASADEVYSTAYRRVTKRFAVIKRDHLQKGLYVRSREYPTKYVGYVGFEPGVELLMEYDGSAIDVTHFQNSLFVCFDSKIVQFCNGRSGELLLAGEDEAFIRISTIITGDQGYLVVLSSTKDYLNCPTATISIYRIV